MVALFWFVTWDRNSGATRFRHSPRNNAIPQSSVMIFGSVLVLTTAEAQKRSHMYQVVEELNIEVTV